MAKQVTWFEAYNDLVLLLKDFYKEYGKRSGKVFYDLCIERGSEFLSSNTWANKFAKEWDVHSFDPVHIFASFNYNEISIEKRVANLKFYIKLISNHLNKNISTDFEIENFDGIPAPIIYNIVSARDYTSQEEIWDFFNTIIEYRQNRDTLYFQLILSDFFILSKRWYGLRAPSLSIFLYWIDSQNFISLDRNTENLLVSNDIIKAIPTDIHQYVNLLKKIPTSHNNFIRNIVKVAYSPSFIQLLPESEKIELENFLIGEKNLKQGEKPLILENEISLKLVAIEVLDQCSENFVKTLETEELYYFSSLYGINKQRDTVIYNSDEFYPLYDIDNLKINIHAIAGKNGSGKSTITELLLATINNIAKNFQQSLQIEYIENLHVALYLEIDKLYKYVINGQTVKIYAFEKKENVYRLVHKDIRKKLNLHNFFYTLLANYSQYALNSRQMGSWIEKIFHKNDAYQTPILIEPFRDEGNIDINRQHNLVKSRLIANLLEKTLDAENPGFRKLTEFSNASKLTLSINEDKIAHVYKLGEQKVNWNQVEPGAIDYVFKKVRDVFEIGSKANTIHISPHIFSLVKQYIFKKIISITLTYDTYKGFLKKPSKLLNGSSFGASIIDDDVYQVLSKDTSHITNKLYQALYFIEFCDEFDTLDTLYQGYVQSITIDLDKLSDNIENIKRENIQEPPKTICLIPPPFLDVDILLTTENQEISFDTLSSGEKQKIFFSHSLIYQLKNISSVNNQRYVYRDVNIILDEIELYQHPEMQRTFINDLLKFISLSQQFGHFESLRSLNLCFITHSPFILSDIPASHVMLLDRKPDQKTRYAVIDFRTFGANIHELLADGFFLNKTIGEFASSKIEEIINISNLSHKDIDKAKRLYLENREYYWYLVNCIGEPYIRGVLQNNLEELDSFYGHFTKDGLDIKIRKYEQIIEDLKNKRKQYD